MFSIKIIPSRPVSLLNAVVPSVSSQGQTDSGFVAFQHSLLTSDFPLATSFCFVAMRTVDSLLFVFLETFYFLIL
jgi:hypothetical protein